MNRENFEIMSPVGSWESLYAAFQAGADSIYFGLEHLNMRSRSSEKFTTQDLKEISNLCNKHRVKSYLTLNTVMYNEDLNDLRSIIDTAYNAGVSAIIASDVAVMNYCSQAGMPLHLSTQLNISNIDALSFYARFADVVVLARELNLEQVKDIHKQIYERAILGPGGKPVQIEMFCHGALCMAISGKCYLSLNELGTSANRGACMQICRRGYIVRDKESDIELEIDNQYIMSPKDLKTIRFIDKMIDSGVTVFKIEGRARGPEYVKIVTECYREAIESCIDGSFTKEKKDLWDRRLSTVFNRGFWDGYYLGQRLGEWNSGYGSQASEKKVYVGKCTDFFSKLEVGEFLIEANSINHGDKILITGNKTGAIIFNLENPRIDNQTVITAQKGSLISFKTPEKVRRNDKLYKLELRK
ncbi:MAG TPA: peptidase U32 family protein [Bacteroidaceae bacterium]|nr:peptidase U32 family protein [Bacteroidaceae bacterium]